MKLPILSNCIEYVPPEYLNDSAKFPAIKLLKARSYTLMGSQAGSQVLDVGCGPGIDTTALASIVGANGQVVGIDHDPGMVALARQRAVQEGVEKWTRHEVANCSAMPFPNSTFDACRSERLLQHLDPNVATSTVSEMARITKSGGRVVIIDTDWNTLSIDCLLPEIERKLVAAHASRFRNPGAGRSLLRYMKACGLRAVRIEPTSVTLEASAVQYLFKGAFEAGQTHGYVSAIEWQQWNTMLEQAVSRKEFFAQLTMVVASGEKTDVTERITAK
jgi:ubiquinone/menaquinone biosynthesis C-methylase UbiE